MKIKKSTAVFIGSIVALSSVGFFMRSSFFNIQEIKVQAETADIKKFVENSLSSVRGENIWEIEPDELSTLLTSKSMSIQSVLFQRHWPSTLKVTVEERKPVAQTFVEGEMWIIDGEGVSFKKKLMDLPLYWPLPKEKRYFHESLSWLATDHPKGVNGLTWDKELGLVVLYEKGTKIILGTENYSANWKKAQETIEYLKSRNTQAHRIDATYNNRAVVSL